MLSDQVSVVSYAGGCLIFLAFTLISLYTTLKNRSPFTLVIPAATTTFACFYIAYTVHKNTELATFIPIVEIIKNGTWLIAILSVLKFSSGVKIPFKFHLLIHAIWVLLLVLNSVVLPLPPPETIQSSPFFIWNGLLLSILGLVAVEQLFRNSYGVRQTRLISISIGALFLYDLYLYAHALVFKQLDIELWQARGFVIALAGVILNLGFLAFNARSSYQSDISISRPIIFYTTSLTMAGFFLALMAAGGYYIKLYGGTWGTVIQVVLIFSACLMIAIVFVSRTLRIRLSVFIDKHFFNHKYDYRTEWLKLIAYLSQSSEDLDFHERAIRAIASIFKSPGGCLWLHNHNGMYWPTACYNLDLPDESLTEVDTTEFCAAMREQEWVFSPLAPESDETSKLNDLLPSWTLEIPQLWLIIPLLLEDELMGFIGLAKPPHANPLTWEDLDLLKTVGRQLTSYLARHEAAELLAQSKQFEAYNKLTAFIMHDLKNLIAQQALVVKNATKHKDNPAFIEDMIHTIDNSVGRMNNLLQKLQQKDSSSAVVARIDLHKVLIEATQKCHDRYPIPSLRLDTNSATAHADKDHMEMVLIHIIKNAQEATDSSGYVDVTLSKKDGKTIIEVEDNGTGMDEDFIKNRLFKPFDTTKSGKGMGIGVYQAREFIRSIGGNIGVQSEAGSGTCFTIELPSS
ncbi:MAG: PEP-CTERM system histidine kinase PrsK [Pseudomonadales bacterium]|nr:PEP-CTERM system histidine kinase PrsK [Pseudomonadales bacterium]